MKKLFVVLALSLIATSIFAQPDPTRLAGIWRLTLMNSGGKIPPPPQYISFKSNNTYIWGVDSLGVDLNQGTMTGTWFLTSENDIVMISADSSMEIRYYRPQGEWKYRFDPTQKGTKKERAQTLEMDIYLEKLRKTSDK